MIPGPNYVYKCPNCGNLVTKSSLLSGNTFGAKRFSDGKSFATMLPGYPGITKCKKCDTIFWLNELNEIGIYDWTDDSNSEWVNADKAEFLEIEDYYSAINNGIAENKEEELMIRKQIWWAYNDKSRKGLEIFNDENDELRWIENVKKLKTLLDQSDINQKIMIAEIHRNLGEFDQCVRIIESIDNDDLNWLKEKFIHECELKNKRVIALN